MAVGAQHGMNRSREEVLEPILFTLPSAFISNDWLDLGYDAGSFGVAHG
jgi:hypothetical protein